MTRFPALCLAIGIGAAAPGAAYTEMMPCAFLVRVIATASEPLASVELIAPGAHESCGAWVGTRFDAGHVTDGTGAPHPLVPDAVFTAKLAYLASESILVADD